MIEFFVAGKPAPQGSMVSGRSKSGFNFMRHSNKKTEPWRAVVSYTARQEYTGEPLSGALRMELLFCMPRPKAHYGKHGLKPNAPYWCSTVPDIDKLIRAVGDSLTGICYLDDKQIVRVEAKKIYGEQIGCKIAISAAVTAENKKEE
jgi:crossover junction endodeoxyribonuclease RusA